jgi:hypothetical protein
LFFAPKPALKSANPSAVADKPLISCEIASIGRQRTVAEQHRKAVYNGVSALAPGAMNLLAGQLQRTVADRADHPAEIGLSQFRRRSGSQ